MKYIIYAHTNKINNKKYIGITKNSIESRSGKNGKKYLSKENGKYKHRKFAKAILKYGWNNFNHEILDYANSLDEAKELEILYINKFNSFNKGYNSTYGGDNVGIISKETRLKMSNSKKLFYKNNPDYKDKIVKNLLKQKRDRHIISEETRKKLSNSKVGNKNPMFNKIPKNKNKGNEIKGINLKTGEEKIFSSAKEASEFLKLKTSSTVIKCCKHERKQTAGWSFEYTGKTFSLIKNITNEAAANSRKKRIEATSIKDGKIIIFNSLEEARIYCNLKNSTSITACIKNRQKSSGGFYWKLLTYND